MSAENQTKENVDARSTECVASSTSAETKLQRSKCLHKKLAETLNYSTVALQFAVAYIKFASENTNGNGDQRFGIEEYLKVYEQKRAEVADLNSDNDQKTDVATLALLIILDAMAKKEEYKAAKEICLMLAYMAPCKPIPLELINNLEVENSTEQSVFQDATKLVGYFALCIINEDNQTIQMDLPVQQLVKKNITDVSEHLALEMGLKLLNKVELDGNLKQHALSVWKKGSTYPGLIKEYHNLVIKILLVPLDYHDLAIQFSGFHKFATEQKELLSKNLSADNLCLIRLEDALFSIKDSYWCDRSSSWDVHCTFKGVLQMGVYCEDYYTPSGMAARFKNAIDLSNKGRVREAHDMFKNVHDACVSRGPDFKRKIVLTIEGHMTIWKYELDELCAHDCAEKLKSIIKDIGESTGAEDDFTPYFKAKAAMVLYEGGEHDLSAKLLMEIRQVRDYYWGKGSSLLKLVV